MHIKKLQKFTTFSAMKKILIISSVIGLFALTGCENEGCTDPDATNYDSAAEENDGSCLYDDDNNNETEAGQDSTGTASEELPLAEGEGGGTDSASNEGEEVSEEGPVSEGEGVSEEQPVAEGEGEGGVEVFRPLN